MLKAEESMKKLQAIIITVIGLLGTLGCEAKGAFSWGVDMGTSIDMTSNDMTSLDLSASFGYRNSWINLAGVGAGINMSVANSHQAIPVFAIFRTGFLPRPTKMFADMRGGIIINNLPGNSRQTSAYINPSVGFSLARGDKFHSYITLGYVYNGLKSFGSADNRTRLDHGLSMVNMRIGITF